MAGYEATVHVCACATPGGLKFDHIPLIRVHRFIYRSVKVWTRVRVTGLRFGLGLGLGWLNWQKGIADNLSLIKIWTAVQTP